MGRVGAADNWCACTISTRVARHFGAAGGLAAQPWCVNSGPCGLHAGVEQVVIAVDLDQVTRLGKMLGDGDGSLEARLDKPRAPYRHLKPMPWP